MTLCTMIYFCNYFLLFTHIVLPSLVMANFYTTTDDGIAFPKNFVGSNLFGDGRFVKKCFSMEDVALLSARSKFEVDNLFVNRNIPSSF